MNSEQILDYLTMVSNQNLALNLTMHILALVAILGIILLRNQKIQSLLVNGTILVLFMSVAVIAYIYGNPFHLITFAFLAVVTTLELLKGHSSYNHVSVNANTIILVMLIAGGLWYPEFIAASKLELLLVSPVGVVPCPTLLTALGLMGLSYPKVSKKLYASTILLGILYGIIGTFIFKVYLDSLLLFAAGYSLVNFYRLVSTGKYAYERKY